MDITADGKYLITAAENIKVWDTRSGTLLRTIEGVKSDISEIAVSPDGKIIASYNDDIRSLTPDSGSILLWDLQTGKLLKALDESLEYQTAMEFSPDGRSFYSFGLVGRKNDKTAWDTSTWTKRPESAMSFIDHSLSCVDLATFDERGAYLAIISYVQSGDGELRSRIDIYDWKMRARVFSHTIDSFRVGSAFAFRPGSSQILFQDSESSFNVMDFLDSKLTCSVSFSGRLRSLTFSPDGATIAGSMGEWSEDGKPQGIQVSLWNATIGLPLRTIPIPLFFDKGSYPQFLQAMFGKDQNILWLRTDDPMGKDKSIRSINLASGSPGFVLGLRKADPVKALAFSPDGKSFSTGHSFKNIAVWGADTGKRSALLAEQNAVFSLAYLDSGSLISACFNEYVREWDLGIKTERRNFPGFFQFGARSVVLSPDKSLIAYIGLSSNSSTAALVCDAKTGKQVFRIDFLDSGISHTGLAFANDSKSIFVQDAADSVRQYTISGPLSPITLVSGTLGHINSLLLSPDGTKLLVGTENHGVYVYDLKAGRVAARLGDSERGAASMAASGATLAIGAYGGGISFWDLRSMSEVWAAERCANVTALAFSPDGKRLLAGGGGGAELWDLSARSRVATFLCLNMGDYVVYTDDGYFDASPGGAKLLSVRTDSAVLPMESYFSVYYRPDIVAARLRGEDTSHIAANDIRDGARTPPEVAISAKTRDGAYRGLRVVEVPDYLIQDGALSVRVTATDTGGGVAGVRVFNNDKVVGEGTRGPGALGASGAYSFDFVVTLTEGLNSIKAIGLSEDMTESIPATLAISYSGARQPKPDMYILAIGINSYRNSKYNLNYCSSDATSFVSALVPKARRIYSNIVTAQCLDGEATRAKVLAALEELKGKIKPTDVFILFYAGHGITLDIKGPDGRSSPEFFYILNGVTQMTDGARCASDGISGSEMKSILAGIKALKQVVFVDACNSGAFAASFALRGAAEENALAKLNHATGVVVFASTTQDQNAAEYAALKHGVFTYVLLEALGGGASLANGQLTAGSLKVYIDDAIPRYSERYRGSPQFPVTFMCAQDFPLALVER